jgi:hypothetical protein
MGATQAALGGVLASFAEHIGTAPDCTALAPPILMPMHLAVDATPFLVASPSGAMCFLKLYQPDMLPFIDIGAAIAASAQAGACGLGPAVRAHDAALGAILFDWLAPASWRMAMRGDLTSVDVQAAVIGAKRAWHRSPRLANMRSPFDTIRAYHETITRLRSENPALAVPPACRTLAAWCERLEAGIMAAGIDPVPLHGENTLSNIMLGVGNDVRLVDFDQAANGDAYHDLGAFCLEYCSFDDEIEAAVELYVGRPDRAALARSKLYMIIDDYMWGCWALIAHWSSARATAIEFYKYARNRFVRAIYRLESWDVDALLRQA